jgi:hypothetical protein
VRPLELGADDYITKPFSPRELVLRIRAVLRRLPAESEQHRRLALRHVSLPGAGQRLDLFGRGGECGLKPGAGFPSSRRNTRQPGKSPSRSRASGRSASNPGHCERSKRIDLRAAGVGGAGSVPRRRAGRIASDRVAPGRARE